MLELQVSRGKTYARVPTMSGGGSPKNSAVNRDERENNLPLSTAPVDPSPQPHAQATPPNDDVAAAAPANQQAGVQTAPENLKSPPTNSEKPQDTSGNRLAAPPLQPPSSSNTPPGQQRPPVAVVKRSPEVITESSQTHQPSLGSYRPLTLEASPQKTLRSRSMPSASSYSTTLLHSEPPAGFPGSPAGDIRLLGSSKTILSPGRPPVVSKGSAAGLPLLKFVTQPRGSNPHKQKAGSATRENLGPPSNDAPSTPKPVVSRSETPGRVADISSPSSVGSAVRVSSRAGSRLWRDRRAAAETPELDGRLDNPRFPWVTLVVIALQLRAHWDFLHEHYPGRCASAAAILDDGHWELVAYAAFHHEDIGHLASNVIPFFCKAIVLESALGMSKFAVVLAVIVILVGLLNVTIAQAVYAIAKAPGLHTACAQTFVGVVAAMEVMNRLQFGDWKIHYREAVWEMRPLVYMYLEMVVLYTVSEKNVIPLLSGLLVGVALVFMPVNGNILTSTTKRKGHVYLYVIPCAPVVYLFAASILAAFVFGPYPPHSTESALTFEHPIGKWWLFPALYIGDAVQLTYILLSLLGEGVAMEQELGHSRFLCLIAGMLLFVNFLQDVLTWTVWKHTDAFFGSLPPAARHSGACSCGLVGTLLALKVVRHRRHPDGVFQMASFAIPLPFWQALILELLHLHLLSSSGSSFGHVTGVLTGVFVAYCPWDYLANLATRLGSSSVPTTARTL